MDMQREMADQARTAVDMVAAEFARVLDYSEESVAVIEAVLGGLAEDADTALFAEVALLFGAYIGEMIRRHDPRARWSAGSPGPSAPPPTLVVEGVEASPVAWCFKRLHYGQTANLVDAFDAHRERVSSASLRHPA
ncbi:MAG: hypothetical protein AAF957_20465 [Planctomycetota bacterium]